MSTFVHGVASCSAIDTSGESVSIEGLDITSLARTGTITWEHNVAQGPKGEKLIVNIPAQVVGKILKAKKIFTEEDCSGSAELHFWNKTKIPFVYILAELLDEYCESARECAGKFKYSKDHPEQQSILGFSVEGSELPNSRAGIIIKKSIARKVTLTTAPCNKLCIAEIYDDKQESEVHDDFESLFKSEAQAIELFKSDEGSKLYEQFLAKKENFPTPPEAPTSKLERPKANGTQIGTTAGGQHAFSHGKIRDYAFNPSEHQEGGEFHARAAMHSTNPKLTDDKEQRAALHSNAVTSGGRVESRPARSLSAKEVSSQATGKMQLEKSEGIVKAEEPKGIPRGWVPSTTQHSKLGTVVSMSHPEHGTVSVHKNPENNQYEVKHAGKLAGIKGVKGSFGTNAEAIGHAQRFVHGLHNGSVLARSPANINSDPKLQKSLEAGSTSAAPSTLVNGAAYQTENLSKPKKTDWNKRAKEEYERWPQKDKFESFMAKRMPHLHTGEIKAIGRTLALQKSIDLEKSLAKLIKK